MDYNVIQYLNSPWPYLISVGALAGIAGLANYIGGKGKESGLEKGLTIQEMELTNEENASKAGNYIANSNTP